MDSRKSESSQKSLVERYAHDVGAPVAHGLYVPLTQVLPLADPLERWARHPLQHDNVALVVFDLIFSGTEPNGPVRPGIDRWRRQGGVGEWRRLDNRLHGEFIRAALICEMDIFQPVPFGVLLIGVEGRRDPVALE